MRATSVTDNTAGFGPVNSGSSPEWPSIMERE